MAYVIKVLVVSKNSRKSLSDETVKLYGGGETKTDSSGMATLIANNSTVSVYVNGRTVYDGYASSAPDPIIFEK